MGCLDRGGGDPAAPPRQFLASTAAAASAGCQGQPGDLAGPGCNPVVWQLHNCLGQQPGQQGGP